MGFKDEVSIELRDDLDEPQENAEYELTLPDGKTRKGKLDADDKVQEKDIPPGNVKVSFGERESIEQTEGESKRSSESDREKTLSVPSGKNGKFTSESFRFSE
ncbi:MAG: hypothetical protein GF350_13165 [Chitinivibrionales bacterium]|nr:hypothetical protein [Chitinivibrionales bacterium]